MGYPINKNSRGISGESVLKKLKSVLPELAANKVEIAVNCVVTTANLKSMSELAESVHAVSDSILISFTPVMPPDGPLSILQSNLQTREFFETFERLKNKGYFVMHAFDGITRFNDFNAVQCFNQYFVIRLSPEGNVLTCSLNANQGLRTIGTIRKKYFQKMVWARRLLKLK